MSELHAFKALLRAPRMDVAVLLTTFGLTVLFDLTIAVEIGLMMSVILFMKRMTDVTEIRQVTEELRDQRDEQALRSQRDAMAKRQVPKGVEVFEAEGAFFFGVAELLRDTLRIGKKAPKVIILRMRHVLALDATALRALRDLRRSCTGAGTTLMLSGLKAQPLQTLERAELMEEFGRDNVVADIDAALARAEQLVGAKT